ncbi:MAG: helix-turn-helix transcriptional regulator [Flavobacteriales bacterium]|nr:helix-turn-helix transcriptional regulator [Flavobacteriales bacterium]
MSPDVEIKVHGNCYLRDPMQSELGRAIIAASVGLLDEAGYESFTFKKLAEKAHTTEASVYRYFTNKRQLLVYLLNWYWLRTEHLLLFKLNNLQNPKDRLTVFIETLTTPVIDPPFKSHVDESQLYNVVTRESAKAFMSIEVDNDNHEGYFTSYKRLSKNLAKIITELRPGYAYTASLASIILEASHNMLFYRQHLPSLTEIQDTDALRKFLIQLAQ